MSRLVFSGGERTTSRIDRVAGRKTKLSAVTSPGSPRARFRPAKFQPQELRRRSAAMSLLAAPLRCDPRSAPAFPAHDVFRHGVSIPRLSASVNAATFRCMPASLARLTALLRKSAEKSACVVAKEIGDRRGAVFVARREGRVRCGGLVIPGADFLADVAAEGVAGEVRRCRGSSPRCSIVA